ncbi:MAG: hypothetical protein KAS71_10925 [Bacteroidales bacterium]|nr:hypothetical protein [Bacteroidales bacterium]
MIIEQPATDFFNMVDVFSSEQFLLYSPGITNIRKKQTTMVKTAGDILKKKIVLNEYEGKFTITPSEESKEDISKLNALMALVMPEINAGGKPDVEALAQKVGMDIETARELVQHLLEKFDDMNREME